MAKVELQQGSAEWHAFRSSHIGASDLPIIMGVSKWTTPLQLWRERLGFAANKDDGNKRYGRDMEASTLESVNKMMDQNFAPAVFVCDELPWASASLDGWDESSNTAVEIKQANADDHKTACSGDVPTHYYPQVQWQMFVCDLQHIHYASRHKGDIQLIEVARDDDYITKCLEAAAEFRDYLDKMIAPPMHDRDHSEIDVDDNFLKLAAEFREVESLLKSQYAPLKKRRDDLKKALCEYTDDGNSVGGGITFTRVVPEPKPDYKSLWEDLCARFPEVAAYGIPDTYIKESIGYWKLTLEK